jgi:hypothetical protein
MRRLAGFLAALVAVAGAAGAGRAAAITADARGGCHYRVAVDSASVDSLAVRFRCAGEGPVALSGFRGIAVNFSKDFRPAPGGTMERRGGTLVFTGSRGVTRGAYRFDMKALLAAVAVPSIGQRIGGSVVTSVSSFPVYPAGRDVPLSIAFVAPAGVGVATALRRTGTVQYLRSRDVPVSGYMVLGRMSRHAIRLPGQPGADGKPVPSRLDVAVLDVPMAVPPADLTDWIRQSATRVSRYFHGFPVRRALLVLRPVPGASRVLHGVVMSGGGPTIWLSAGARVDRARLFGDWRLVHELIHTGSPFLGRGGRWLNEGIAVYVQTLVHVRAGWLDARQAWRGFMTRMPRGLGALTGDGLSSARGIGNVYWGGALFMLLADVDIRERTDGRKTLGDCLRGVLRDGGTSAARWTVARMLRACDAATGTGTMARLAARHVARGAPLDLDRLWRDLGVSLTPDGVRYDDAAPLARYRRAIMRGPATR